MKKLNSINWVSFKEDKLYLEDIPITLGLDIKGWLKEHCNIEYEKENFVTEYPEYELYKFSKDYVIVRVKNDIIISIEIYPYEYQSSPYYKGDIFIFDKKLAVPFKSDNIEIYFPDIKIKPKRYGKRFAPRETVDYPVSETVKIKISLGRDSELVGALSLKAI